MGQKCGFVIAGDDVSVGKKGSMVGRRGLAGHVSGVQSSTISSSCGSRKALTQTFPVLKMLGAASASGASFEDCMALGQAGCGGMVSIASTLDHCHVPGRTEHAMLAPDEIELGTGPHNEPVRTF